VSYSLVFTESYSKRARKFLKKHPELSVQYLKTLQLLGLDPYHRSLRLHALEGRLAGLHSVSIHISYRITLEFLVDGNDIVPVNVGTHDDVYRK